MDLHIYMYMYTVCFNSVFILYKYMYSEVSIYMTRLLTTYLPVRYIHT